MKDSPRSSNSSGPNRITAKIKPTMSAGKPRASGSKARISGTNPLCVMTSMISSEFDGNAYTKGGWVSIMLRHELGDDAFYRA